MTSAIEMLEMRVTPVAGHFAEVSPPLDRVDPSGGQRALRRPSTAIRPIVGRSRPGKNMLADDGHARR
jgi:hypothetical protein